MKMDSPPVTPADVLQNFLHLRAKRSNFFILRPLTFDYVLTALFVVASLCICGVNRLRKYFD